MRLGALAYAPIDEGATGEEALQASGRLVQHAEGLGYSRYWVAEHHGIGAVASVSPEMLMSFLAARTSTTRTAPATLVRAPPRPSPGCWWLRRPAGGAVRARVHLRPFINPSPRGVRAVEAYRQAFRRSAFFAEPEVIVAVAHELNLSLTGAASQLQPAS